MTGTPQIKMIVPIGPTGAPGTPGAVGPAGPPGPTGPEGPTGPTGPQGIEGPTGPRGPVGVATRIIGSLTARTSDELPATGVLPADWDAPGNPQADYQCVPGDALICNSPADPFIGQSFQYVGTGLAPSGWLNIGTMVGPEGPVGPQGSQGPTGPQGPKGDQGAPGTTGADGSPGTPGTIGPEGPAGPTGPPGPEGPAGPAGVAYAEPAIHEVPVPVTLTAGETEIIMAGFFLPRSGDSWVKATLSIGGAFADNTVPMGTEYAIIWRAEGSPYTVATYHKKLTANDNSITGATAVFMIPVTGAGSATVRILGTSPSGTAFTVHPTNVLGIGVTVAILEDCGPRSF